MGVEGKGLGRGRDGRLGEGMGGKGKGWEERRRDGMGPEGRKGRGAERR